MRGKRRLHKRANAAEIEACLRWLDAEVERIKPQYLVCLGALATKVFFGNAFKLQQRRGEWIRLDDGCWAMATVHPSFVLRSRIASGYEAAYAEFVADLRLLQRLPE